MLRTQDKEGRKNENLKPDFQHKPATRVYTCYISPQGRSLSRTAPPMPIAQGEKQSNPLGLKQRSNDRGESRTSSLALNTAYCSLCRQALPLLEAQELVSQAHKSVPLVGA